MEKAAVESAEAKAALQAELDNIVENQTRESTLVNNTHGLYGLLKTWRGLVSIIQDFRPGKSLYLYKHLLKSWKNGKP